MSTDTAEYILQWVKAYNTTSIDEHNALAAAILWRLVGEAIASLA